MEPKVIGQQVKWDEKLNQTSLIIKYSDNSIRVEPIDSEIAAQWQAEHRF